MVYSACAPNAGTRRVFHSSPLLSRPSFPLPYAFLYPPSLYPVLFVFSRDSPHLPRHFSSPYSTALPFPAPWILRSLALRFSPFRALLRLLLYRTDCLLLLPYRTVCLRLLLIEMASSGLLSGHLDCLDCLAHSLLQGFPYLQPLLHFFCPPYLPFFPLLPNFPRHPYLPRLPYSRVFLPH